MAIQFSSASHEAIFWAIVAALSLWVLDHIIELISKPVHGLRSWSQKPGITLCIRYFIFGLLYCLFSVLTLTSMVLTHQGRGFTNGFMCCVAVVVFPVMLRDAFKNTKLFIWAMKVRMVFSELDQLRRRLTRLESEASDLQKTIEAQHGAREVLLLQLDGALKELNLTTLPEQQVRKEQLAVDKEVSRQEKVLRDAEILTLRSEIKTYEDKWKQVIKM